MKGSRPVRRYEIFAELLQSDFALRNVERDARPLLYLILKGVRSRQSIILSADYAMDFQL